MATTRRFDFSINSWVELPCMVEFVGLIISGGVGEMGISCSCGSRMMFDEWCRYNLVPFQYVQITVLRGFSYELEHGIGLQPQRKQRLSSCFPYAFYYGSYLDLSTSNIRYPGHFRLGSSALWIARFFAFPRKKL